MASSEFGEQSPEEVVMFSRFRKEESAERKIPTNLESLEIPTAEELDLDSPPDVVEDDCSDEQVAVEAAGDDPADVTPVDVERLSTEEALQLLSEESEQPLSGEPLDEQPTEDADIAFSKGSYLEPDRPRRRKTPLMVKPKELARHSFTPQQRLLLLDTWQRSGLPAKDFADLIGVSKHTLYKWKQLFERLGPEGLLDQSRKPRRGSRLPEVTKRTILMLKQAHPDWGCQRISDMLLRGPALSASATAVSRVLRDAGYETVSQPTRPHGGRPRTFERAKPNQLWQTDLFTFMLKRQNRRVYLVAFMDDHSRFIVSYGLHGSSSTALVIEALEAGISNYGLPEEVLTDNGPQYVTWRGKSRFTKQLEKRGIRQIVAKPKRPQTLGKVERFWGTLWRELIEGAVFVDLTDARQRIGHYLDYYNFMRTHTGIGGLVPADRFFAAGDQVRLTLQQRVADNALQLARQGAPKAPFYVTGQVEGQSFSVHSQGERLVLTRDGQQSREIELTDPPAHQEVDLSQPVCPCPSLTDDSSSAEDQPAGPAAGEASPAAGQAADRASEASPQGDLS